MRVILTLIGIAIGAFFGILAGGFVGWLIVRISAGPHALSNPDLPGGMAWFFVFIAAAVGLLAGGVVGIALGKRLFLRWQTESYDSSDVDP